MIASTRHSDRYTLATHWLGAAARVDDQGYLHTGRAQRQPDRVVVACGRTGGER